MQESHENEAFEGDAAPSCSSSSVTGGQEDQQVSPSNSGSSSSNNEFDSNKDSALEFSSLNEDEVLGRQLELKIDNALETIKLTDFPTKQNGLHYEAEPKTSAHSREEFMIEWQNLNYVVESKWYKLSNQRKPILDNLCGSFKSGELSAVLGPSGAGKSTFIDCLLGKRERGLSGKTRVIFNTKDENVGCNLEKRKRSKRLLKFATIPQEDHLLNSLTVTETFMFASKIKNAHLVYEEDEEGELGVAKDGARKPFDHFANVQRVIQQLNLSSCATQRCGKLSGGQYKRVSIGQELLSRPDIMFLDEPTSGLDSVTCYQTIKALRTLIESSPYPMAIVATIHQPDVEVFNLFHKAYVLATGGRAIYEGPTDSIFSTIKLGTDLVEARRREPAWSLSNVNWAADLSPLHKQLDEQREQINPARLIVEVAASEYGFEITSSLNEIQRQQFLIDSPTRQFSSDRSSNSDEGISRSSSRNLSTLGLQSLGNSQGQFDYPRNDILKKGANLDKLLNIKSANMRRKRSIGVFTKHLIYHTHRSWLTIVRDPMLFSVQLLLHIFVPLLISYSYQGRDWNDACPQVGSLDIVSEAYRRDGNILDDLNRELRASFENLGYMFFQVYVILFAGVCMTSLTYPLDMHVLLKEYRNGWYSMSSYFLGRTMADLPIPTMNVVIAMAISYHLTGQALSPYGWRFICVALLTVLATLVAQTQGLMFGALLMNAPQSAVFVAPASTAPLVVVSGFLFRIKTLPWVLQVLSKFSYVTHLLNGFIVARYGFNRCPCNEDDFLIDETHQVPQQARGVINIWLETFGQEFQRPNGSKEIDLVDKLVDTISEAKTFGFQMTNCSQVKPFTMLDYDLQDSDLTLSIAILVLMLISFRWIAYLVLYWRIKLSA